jgi:cell division inhibitor SepF
MANPLKKSLIYLGLADEELEYDDQHERATEHEARQTSPQPVAQPAQPQAAAQPSRPAPTAHAAQKHAPASPVQAAPAPAHKSAPVTPLRRTATSTKNAAPTDMNEILTVHPREYKDAQSIAASFRDGIPVIINLSQMSEGDARRLVDFASGLSQGLYGKIERVTNKVFLLSPSHIMVNGDQAEVESDIEASFFAQS